MSVGLLPTALLSLARPAAVAAYTSPFSIQLSPQINSWTTDFAARQTLVNQQATPTQLNWNSSNYIPGLPYGPLNPQLFGVSSGAIVNPSLVNQLRYDRGEPVYNQPLPAAPAGTAESSWATQRLMAAANQLIGTPYQHLHLPAFDPAPSAAAGRFTWLAVSNQPVLQTSQQLVHGTTGPSTNPYASSYGLPEPGIDCTDFTAYIYNWALGIQMHSGTPTQIGFTSGFAPSPSNDPSPQLSVVLNPRGAAITPTFIKGPNYGFDQINRPESFQDLINAFQPGDLLYMGGSNGIVHVVMWLGAFGTLTDGSPSPVPLVISSHDNTPAIFDITSSNDLDSDGYPIVPTGSSLDEQILAHLPPPGVHILPFTPDTWFYQNFQVAMRVLPTTSAPAPAAPLGLLTALGFARRLRCRLRVGETMSSGQHHQANR